MLFTKFLSLGLLVAAVAALPADDVKRAPYNPRHTRHTTPIRHTTSTKRTTSTTRRTTSTTSTTPTSVSSASITVPTSVSSVSSSSVLSVSATPSVTGCANSASDRSCWGNYNLSTNYYEEVPDTGVTREYWFDITNSTAAPDGIERVILSVNGSVPGPTIFADWGDNVVVHVRNMLENNGTGIHFHGIRQNYTSQNDGVPSVTQCPIAQGETYTYTWRATQYGSSWYHSHYYVQAWDGVFGGIQINGPASADYDEDLGPLFLNDWMHLTADQEVVRALLGAPPILAGGLINGTNEYNDTTTGTVTGSRFETTFEAGKRYRLRLVNAAADTQFVFSIDGHSLEVIASDFVPIVPYTANSISLSMGQRYDVIVAASGTAEAEGGYWLRATVVQSCSSNDSPNNVLGIVRYDGSSSTADPTTTGWPAVDDAATATCADEDMANLVPYVPITASNTADTTDNLTVALFNSGDLGLWQMGSTTFINEWDYPTLLQVYENNDTWTNSQCVYQYPDANQWAYLIIQTTVPVPHPIHMHGHDFWILGQGSGTFDAATANLTYVNPPRRDTVLLPGNGYIVIAFYTDNPGAWTVHCHIAWHTTEGLAIQLLERESEIVDTLDADSLQSTCAAWDLAEESHGFHVLYDSGL